MVPGAAPIKNSLCAVPEDNASYEEAAHERRRLAADESIAGKGTEYDQVAEATLDAGRADEMIRLHPRGRRAICAGEVRQSVASRLRAGTEVRRD